MRKSYIILRVGYNMHKEPVLTGAQCPQNHMTLTEAQAELTRLAQTSPGTEFALFASVQTTKAAVLFEMINDTH